ncbi:hypothetical protein [Desulfosporosinus sp.]|uniref:hypothetical protein n=1 Tax=Desulfosporosinus sp. TaxID=157907 RepID=UPI00261CF917|nr:hypothetical protein [Desulfosporosinus sp.]MCO5384613.1 hypothetical protein [Desulfosporosinus sp.]
MVQPKGKETSSKVIYLPSIYDPKKVREAILEILSLVKGQEDNVVSKKEVS